MQRAQGGWDTPVPAACRLWGEWLKPFLTAQPAPVHVQQGQKGICPCPNPMLFTFCHSINCSLPWFALMNWTKNQNWTVCLSHWISKREYKAFYLKAGSQKSTRICPRGLLLLKASSIAEKDSITQARTPGEKREAWYVLGFMALNTEECKSTFLLIINDLSKKIFYLKPMETLCWLQRQGFRVRALILLTNLTSLKK